MKAPDVSTAESHFSRPTLYMGDPSDAKAKLAFFAMDNLQIELIQSGGWDGGTYSYIDGSKEIGCMLELLENFK
jgi:hypothetical protein